MSFKDHWLRLPVAERESVAQRAMTTRGTLNQVAYASKRVELGLADCLMALMPGLALADIPLTDRAKQQAIVRATSLPTPEPTNAGEACHG